MKLKNGQMIPNSEILKLRKAFEETKGKENYTKYYMEITALIDGKWEFIGHGVPCTLLDAKVSKSKGKAYLVFQYKYAGTDRYELTDAVMDLMGWEV